MQLCAIICEYNPLHLGHAWQIEQAKRRFGSVVCIMSGSFVQRGEPAVLDKFTRAQCALKAGADAVFALPCLFFSAIRRRLCFGRCPSSRRSWGYAPLLW